MPNKRSYARVQFIEKAHLKCDGINNDCCVMDISLKGALLRFPKDKVPQLQAEQKCVITMVLEGSDICLEFNAIANHFNDDTIGFYFIFRLPTRFPESTDLGRQLTG